MSDIEVIEVLVPGQPGAKGDTGEKGDKGDTGDVTPAALAAAESAEESADAAASSASAAALAATTISAASWAGLVAITPAFIGQRAQVSANDAGTHSGRTAASPDNDAASVANSGVYGAYSLATGAWRRDGPLTATAAASAANTVAGAGVDTFVTPEADKAALDARMPRLPGTATHVFCGPDLKAHTEIYADGTIVNSHIQRIEADASAGAAAGASLVDIVADEIVGGFLGQDRKAVFQVRASGQIDNAHIARIETDLTALRPSDEEAARLAPVVPFLHFMIYGQSLSTGEMGQPPRSTTPLTWARKFIGGVISRYGTAPDRYASLANLTETTNETIATGMLVTLRQLLLDEDGFDIAAYLPLVSAPGEGGKSASELSVGTTYFDRLKADITAGKARAGDIGLPYQVAALPFLQGEQDYTYGTPAATWKAQVAKLRADVEAWGLSVSGISRPLPMVVYQLAQHVAKATDPTLALAACEMCSEQENIGFATAMYHMPYVDTAHLSPDGYFWLGGYFGLALKRWLWDGRKPMPMSPASVAWWDGGVSLQFPSQEGGLMLDTAAVTNPGNYGFELRTSDGATPIAISGVSVVGQDRVVIQSGAAIPAGARLRYAWSAGTDLGTPRTGPTNGARGNLRDRRGNIIKADPSGSAFPLHQWAPIFEVIRP